VSEGGLEHVFVAYLHRAGIHATDHSCMRWRVLADRDHVVAREHVLSSEVFLPLVFRERTRSGVRVPSAPPPPLHCGFVVSTVSVCEPQAMIRTGSGDLFGSSRDRGQRWVLMSSGTGRRTGALVPAPLFQRVRLGQGPDPISGFAP
jgi:hypothetical protein